MYNISFFSLKQDMINKGVDPKLALELKPMRDYMLNDPYMKANPAARAKMKEQITARARMYSNTPFNSKFRDDIEYAAQASRESASKVGKRFSSRRLAVGAGVAGLAGLGLGAYALSRRNNQQEQS